MQIKSPQDQVVVKDPASWRALFLHGDDIARIREFAKEAVTAIAGSVSDPFRVAVLEGEECDRVEEEDSAISLDASKRVIWLRSVPDTEAFATRIKKLLETTGETVPLIVIEHPHAPSASKLRKLCGSAKTVASIACYPMEGRQLTTHIRNVLRQNQILIDQQALTWLEGSLASNQALVESEIEKCALYADQGRPLTIDDVREIVGDLGSASSKGDIGDAFSKFKKTDIPLAEAIHWAMAGVADRADQYMQKAFEEGALPDDYVRILIRESKKLRKALLEWAKGKRTDDVIKELRIFWKEKERFLITMRRWNLETLDKMLRSLVTLQTECRTRGSMAAALTRNHMMRLTTAKSPSKGRV